MSTEVNTKLIERAIELADDLNKPYYNELVAKLVLEGDLDELFSLVKVMSAMKQQKGATK